MRMVVFCPIWRVDISDVCVGVQVRFACSSESTNNLLVSIKEPTTCHYTLIFYTPMLCANHHFKQQEHPVRYINCHATHEEAEAEAAAEACASDP